MTETLQVSAVALTGLVLGYFLYRGIRWLNDYKPPKPFRAGMLIAYGVMPEYAYRPINNLPPDTVSVRRRLRANKPAIAFVKTKTSVERWAMAPDGDCMKLQILLGVNASPL